MGGMGGEEFSMKNDQHKDLHTEADKDSAFQPKISKLQMNSTIQILRYFN
jgi:hypothetical protein